MMRAVRRARAVGSIAAAALVCAAVHASPAGAQIADGGFVPAVVHSGQAQAPLLSAGYAHWKDGDGIVARGDFWFGRIGAAIDAGSTDFAGLSDRHVAGALLLEVVRQGIGLKQPGLQLQAAYSQHWLDDTSRWGVPITAGVLFNGPIPRARRAVIIHLSPSMRYTLRGDDQPNDTEAGVGVRVIFNDGFGILTMFGISTYARVYSDHDAAGPAFEIALSRVLRAAAHAR
jgi:hypothetical protein